MAFTGLGVLLKIKWQYLKRIILGVRNLMGYIEETPRETFFPALFGGEEMNTNFRKILGHSFKRGGLGIPDPRLSVESAHSTSKESCG